MTVAATGVIVSVGTDDVSRNETLTLKSRSGCEESELTLRVWKGKDAAKTRQGRVFAS